MHRSLSLILVLALVAAACGGGDESTLPDDAIVIVVSSDVALGVDRLAVAAIDSGNESLAFPDVDVTFELFRPDGTPAGTTRPEFIWAIPDVRGMWVDGFEFDAPGPWTVGLRTDDGRLLVSAPFNVAAESFSIGIGDAAPPSDSKTIADGGFAEITTDTDPDERLYQLTVADAVQSGSPSVIIFATPAFCVSATCGPSLDVAKGLIDDYGGVNWVHVEVFDNLDATSRADLRVVQAAEEWRLATEPWVFVVDATGTVTARFEGAVGESELRRALDAVAG